MKLSLRWLSQYLTLDYSPEEIADMLTTIGLEVEGWEKIETIKGGLAGVVVGHVTDCQKHPDADKLSLTKVDIGAGEELQIVCGAPNVQKGQKVLVATIGTTLYDKEGNPWKIKKGKIRGVESEGMICAEDELGLGADHSGIMILDESAQTGLAAADYLRIPEDIVFEIGLTPNRSDATSHLGIARDLYAYLKVNKDFQGEIKLPDTTEFITQKVTFNIDVDVLDKEACPRYAGVTLTGVKVEESPEWIKHYLNSVGIKPINNVVDITNYVLHELGQPLHAFDADKIAGRKIIVDCLSEGTLFTTLDNTERKLRDKDLMINDRDKNPLCMAGVYGGISSGVTGETVNIFLESAYFSPSYIRSSSTAHNLRTDAAKVFEKGADPNIALTALKRAAGLIRKHGGAIISNDVVDIYPKPIQSKDIKLRYKKVSDVIGVSLSKEKIQFILSSLDMQVKPLDEDSILVKPGTNKHDVTREIDVIEEILRIYGLNNIPIQSGIKSTLSYSDNPNKNEIKEIVAQFLSNNQYHEMMGLSLIESKHFQEMEEINPGEFVYINNTSNIHLDILRPDLLISGLQSVAYNLNRQQTNIKLFEHGKSYRKNGDAFTETECITLFLSGKNREETWYENHKRDAGFYDMKQTCLSLMNRIGLKGFTQEEIHTNNGLQYGIKLIKTGTPFLFFGEVSRTVLKKCSIKQPVFYAQIDLQNLMKVLGKPVTKVKEITKFPTTRRDLAIILDEHINFSEIELLANKTDKKILREVRLFDIFKDTAKVGENKKSYAVSFHFENAERTLSDKEVDHVMGKITESLENQLKAIIRK